MANEKDAPQQARPTGQPIPTLERKVALQEPSVPDYQSAYLALAKSDTLVSDIGASVAQTASHAMAEQLGYTAGLNPKGNLLPSFTEFDQHFAQTYNTQAAATLGLQAQQLFDTAHVEMSKATRLTPELIESTSQQLLEGLNKITANAPTTVASQLQLKYRAQLSNQDSQYKQKMISQQRDEQKDNLVSLIDTNSKSIYETAKNGDFETAERQLRVNQENIDNGVDNKFWSKAEGQKLKDQARQDLINAEANYGAIAAHKAGKSGEFLKTLVDHKPKNLTDEQYEGMLGSVLKEIQFLDSLVAQDQNLKSQQMLNQIASAPGAITQVQWDTFANSVSPLKAEQVKFSYIQALKKGESDTSSRDHLIQNYDNAEIQAIAEPKVKDAAFLKQVQDAMQNSHQTNIPMKSPEPLSQDAAEVQVATNAGAEIPVFTKILKNKLGSSNPSVSESGAQQIHALLQNGNGQALKGLNDQDWSMYSAIQSLRDSPDPLKANQDAHNRIYNQDPEVEKLNKTKFSNLLTKANSAGVSNDNFALKTFGMSKSDFLNPSIASAYGTNILSKLSNFYAISGDFDEAKRTTQHWVDQNYGDTFINGDKHKTLHPIEKEVGFNGRDGVPYIQQDVINQFNEKLAPIKKQYQDKKVNEYWEPIAVNIKQEEKPIDILKRRALHNYVPQFEMPEGEVGHIEFKTEDVLFQAMSGKHTLKEHGGHKQPSSEASQEHGIFFKTYDPIKIKRHMRTASGEKTEVFNVILVGNSFGKYDIAIETEYGMRNLYKEAPHLGISDYVPNKQAILDSYNKDHK